ncbi:YeeE/YedE family protein [Vibrio sp. JC009]|uniref:YeeE/YedE family protein n=1 Tax=Vibrio sp. JC009 TaxID=2912314 RepID=UPI0023B18091|nr:YeeE/YedE family protein [Vibrio sp. JC009]WED24409.1 YeeE/YedE family protein [Vibrio sp. JC009]
MFRLVSLFAGVLFGMGMAISGMVDPVNVIAFLDVAGNWSADLAFVMGGALAVFMPAYLLIIKPRKKPMIAEEFCLANNKKIDFRLIAGAATFGIGWGLVGICPGPAVASLAAGNGGVVLFFATMMVGLGATNLMICIAKNRQVTAESV